MTPTTTMTPTTMMPTTMTPTTMMPTTMRTTTTMSTTTTQLPYLYQFNSHTFTNAGATGPTGPTLSQVKQEYARAGLINNYLNMKNDNGIQLWTVPTTGSYKIRAVGAGIPYNSLSESLNQFQKGMDVSITTTLIKDEVIQILVGQIPKQISQFIGGIGGAGGTFVIRGTQTPIIVAGGAGGGGVNSVESNSNATTSNSGQSGKGFSDGVVGGGIGGNDGAGGGGIAGTGSGGGGLIGNGLNVPNGQEGGKSFINGGIGGTGYSSSGGFGGGGGNTMNGGSGGGGYSGGGGSSLDPISHNFYISGGGGGSYSITGKFDLAVANNNDNGFVVITANF